MIWQHFDLDDTSDPFTSIDYGSFDAFTGRIGARLEADLQFETMALQPFLNVNLWHNFTATDTIVFNTTRRGNRKRGYPVGAWGRNFGTGDAVAESLWRSEIWDRPR